MLLNVCSMYDNIYVHGKTKLNSHFHSAISSLYLVCSGSVQQWTLSGLGNCIVCWQPWYMGLWYMQPYFLSLPLSLGFHNIWEKHEHRLKRKLKVTVNTKERKKEDETKMFCNYRYLQCSQHNLYPLKLPPIMQYFCCTRKKYTIV
jgi:hypothetical protein